MKLLKLAFAAAIAFGTMSMAGAPAAAQGEHRGEYRQDGNRHDAGRDDNRRGDNRWRGDRGRHHGWRNNRGRHRGWTNRRVCRTIWRHHHRQRICRIIRVRRYR